GARSQCDAAVVHMLAASLFAGTHWRLVGRCLVGQQGRIRGPLAVFIQIFLLFGTDRFSSRQVYMKSVALETRRAGAHPRPNHGLDEPFTRLMARGLLNRPVQFL